MGAADRQLELAQAALDRGMRNEAVALAAAAVERYLKGVLVAENTPFEYTHNIDRLLTRQSEPPRDQLSDALPPRVRQLLTDGGTVARYPGGPSYSPADSESAVAAATAVRATLKSFVPALFGPDGSN